MLQGVLDIYLRLKVLYGKNSNSIMQIVWCKKNNSTSKGMERSVIEISSNFLHLF